jgi:pimeloyl-ACP methyl ester carboxylesterase
MRSIRSKDGTEIAYQRSGHGPPLVLVHGTTADHTRWAPITPALEQRFTVYAADRRGRGASGDAGDYATEREFDDVAALIDSIGEPVVLLGHSFGAICSLEGALRTKDVRKLVLYEPPIPAGLPIYAPGSIERMEALLARGDRASLVSTFFSEIVHMPAAELAVLQSRPSWPARVAAAHTILREMRGAMSYRFESARFETLEVPTLLVLGGDSPPLFQAAIDLVQWGLPHSRKVTLAGQQHVAIDTAPELFVREVTTFLAE